MFDSSDAVEDDMTDVRRGDVHRSFLRIGPWSQPPRV